MLDLIPGHAHDATGIDEAPVAIGWKDCGSMRRQQNGRRVWRPFER
ncbi:MAG: hypothetical protein IH587_06215 [Anaerolineae bacterium]|nr:hypothetical protein [Anaerolineae bacterium]